MDIPRAAVTEGEVVSEAAFLASVNRGCANESPDHAADHGHSHRSGKACAGGQASAHGHRGGAEHRQAHGGGGELGHEGVAKLSKVLPAADQHRQAADRSGQQVRPANQKAVTKLSSAAKLRQELLSPDNKPKKQTVQQHIVSPAVTVVDKAVVESSYEGKAHRCMLLPS